jgi:hypothetical protein
MWETDAGYSNDAPSAKQAHESPSLSYLDLAVQAALEPIVSENSSVTADYVLYTSSFLKTLPLFMKGRFALPLLLTTYAADEAKVGAAVPDQLFDSTLGASKGFALRTIFRYAGRQGLTPGAAGVSLGMGARFSDAALTRANYYNAQGNFDFTQGVHRASSQALNPAALAVDAATFGAADVVWARMFNYSRGSVWYNPSLKSALTAGTMGISAGFGFELHRQITNDAFDAGTLARRTLMHGAFDALAGGLGGLQSKSHMRLGIGRDPADALAIARSTPYQRGEIVDAQQAALRDGKFVLHDRIKGLTTETMIGFVQTPHGAPIRAVFRPNNGSQSFAHRMQSEIAAYGMKSLGFKTSVPVTVARDVEVNGVKRSGYIQQMEGVSLAEFAQTHLGTSTPSRRNLLRYFRENQQFRESYMDAWTERLILGEWDNHALNMAVAQSGSKGAQVKNIDLGDGLRRATTSLDLVPVPGVRQGYDRINAMLYRELAGKKLSTERVNELSSLHQRFSSPEGRAQLQTLGMTGQQVEGVLGRINWFVKQGYWPRQPEAMFYLPLNDARRAVEQWLGKPKQGTTTSAPARA